MVPTLNKMAGAVKFSTHPLHFYTDDADSVSSSFLGAAKCNGDGSSIVLEPIRKNEDEHEDEEDGCPIRWPTSSGSSVSSFTVPESRCRPGHKW